MENDGALEARYSQPKKRRAKMKIPDEKDDPQCTEENAH